MLGIKYIDHLAVDVWQGEESLFFCDKKFYFSTQKQSNCILLPSVAGDINLFTVCLEKKLQLHQFSHLSFCFIENLENIDALRIALLAKAFALVFSKSRIQTYLRRCTFIAKNAEQYDFLMKLLEQSFLRLESIRNEVR